MVVDHELFLKGICSLIGQIFDDFDITQFLSAMDFLENLDDTLPCDVIISDLTMKGVNGLAVVRNRGLTAPVRKHCR